MSATVALASLLHLRRQPTPEELHAEHVYVAEIERAAARVQQLFEEWVALREVEPDNARLANAAAVNRWELMRLAKQIEELDAPRSCAALQRTMHTAVLGSARACQLLANGYRFHKSEAVCDGQALLVQSAQDTSHILNELQLH